MNAFRIGIVESQDAARCRVRVTLPDRDQIHSWWLPVIVPKTQNDKAYYLPDVGEQVVCLMDDYDEEGAVVGSIYSSVDQPPSGLSVNNLRWSTQDGASFDYDRAAHCLSVSTPNGSRINISANGATIAIDASGNIKLETTEQIHLGTHDLKGIARLGDTVTCPAGSGTISTASGSVLAQS